MKTIKKETIIRTIVLVVALINQALTIFDRCPLPFDNAEVEAGVSMILTTCASLWAWWKNNSFTKKAIEADAVLDKLKEAK
jgi:SPP1 family holin